MNKCSTFPFLLAPESSPHRASFADAGDPGDAMGFLPGIRRTQFGEPGSEQCLPPRTHRPDHGFPPDPPSYDASLLNASQVDRAMRAHAGGDAQGPSSVSPPPNAGERNAEPSRPGSRKKSPVVRKGFLESSGSSGSLYGEEGSHEGSGGRGRSKAAMDREFQKLVAEADPDMGKVGGISEALSFSGLVPRLSFLLLLLPRMARRLPTPP